MSCYYHYCTVTKVIDLMMDKTGNILLESIMNLFKTIRSNVLHILRISHTCLNYDHTFSNNPSLYH